MEHDELFNEFLNLLSKKISSMQYSIWFQNSTLVSLENNVLTFKVKNDYIKSYILKQYDQLIEETLNKLNLINYTYEIITEDEIVNNKPVTNNIITNTEIVEPVKQEIKQTSFEIIEESKDPPVERVPIVSNLEPEYTFENFAVGESNQLAFSFAQQVAENPGKLYNPFFIYGKSGLGKTHLMHAIGNKIKENSDLSVLYITSDQFRKDFRNVYSDKKNNIELMKEFNDKYRNVDVLIIDDIQMLETAEKTQDEFFNTFESLRMLKKQVIISSDRSVNDLQLFEERLKTRFQWGLTVEINPTDIDLKIKILKNKINSLKSPLTISDEVLQYIAKTSENNGRVLIGALNRLYAYTTMYPTEEIDLTFAKNALENMLSSGAGTTNSVAKWQKAVADYYNLTVEVLKSKKRTKDIAFARQLAMYMCKMYTEETVERIGLEFKRDHSTVIYAVKEITELIKTDQELNKTINEIKDKLKS